MADELTGLHKVVGIDLGTTYSCVSTFDWDNDESIVLRNQLEANAKTTPSVVGFDRVTARVIVGEIAKRNMPVNPGNTISHIKREMGELFRKSTLAEIAAASDGAGAAAQVEGPGEEGEPYRVRFCGAWYLPQEISAFTLLQMKRIADVALDSNIIDAVITVPAYFTEKQKKATEEAARLAGLYPRQLIPEPTAAAICYGVDTFGEGKKVYLVYDLGGGTFDVSMITVEGAEIRVLSTSGDSRLGGGDFDEAIAQWAMEELREKHDLDVSRDRNAREIIKYHAESAKKAVSTANSADMVLPELRPRNPPVVTLTREKFEELVTDKLRGSLIHVDDAIAQAKARNDIGREQIDGVLLVGGSSKIPLVKSMILDHFEREDAFVRSDLDPDLVVARGAAVLARRFRPSEPPFDMNHRHDDSDMIQDDDAPPPILITEHTLGIAVNDGEMSPIVRQGTNIPVAVTRGGFTNGGETSHLDVQVYQGESDSIFDNTQIGVVPLGPMEPRQQGFHQFEVTFSLDRNGLLAATVHHLNEEQTYTARFSQKTGIGGNDALEAIRKKLAEMFNGGAPAVPPIEPNRDLGGLVPSLDDPPPSAAETEPRAEADAAPPPVGAAGAGNGSPTNGTAPTGSSDDRPQLPKADAPIPAEFRQVERRSRAHLLKAPNESLRTTYCDFIVGLNDGVDETKLQQLGDDLADAFDDARR